MLWGQTPKQFLDREQLTTGAVLADQSEWHGIWRRTGSSIQLPPDRAETGNSGERHCGDPTIRSEGT